ncbi:Regulator of chromosome condensation (RCC1) family with FYVE zinc finger domain-containing protein [Citrus sinensis]|nr:Regulator of chromosome condensation (RCC1) family with FYVE zinc finger domain-containing protein [Citrus sinensis]
MDSFVPKAVESAVVLDVQNIACGGRHAALVTKQGEVFSWGEELGGRLGHGVDSDVSHPKLIDALKNINVELVACGEHHTCAVTLSGDMYTWGGSNCNFGLLGHGNEMSLWLPKKLNGPLEGIHVSSVSCGPWHTAVVTSAGQLFTFGDGTFGVLGHGDRISVSTPREVDSLKGLRTVRAACGVWHTAAVVEVMVGSSSSSNCSSGKLFTWGDGDRGRLGHGDKEARLVPTCVAALVEPNFCQVSCGHSLTVALTTTGHVYTMGSPVYGQLGDPKANGKLPTRVEGKLTKNFVEEIACGDYHVAVLTSRTEVYTWGKGANSRLGHGDTDDRNFPSLVEALKDKQVKSIVCGTSFTAAICLHKWVSGVDQSMCSGCRIPFNFKRKRHNCYNCGLVYCHTCSSKKSVKASMAPNPNKPYRVCDNCFGKLTKATETSSSSHSTVSRRGSMNQGFNEAVEHGENFVSRSHVQFGTSMESLKKVESGSSKRNKKQEFNRTRGLPLPNGVSQGNALNNSKSSNPVFGSTKKFFSASLPGSRIMSRATSPTSRRSSPPRATTPTPTLSGLASPKIVVDDAKRTSEEVIKLRAQVEELTRKSQLQEIELERTTRQLKEALAVAGEETAKCRAAKDVIKSLTAQLKDMAEMLPVGAVRNSNSFHSSPTPAWDVSSAAIEQPSSPLTFQGAIPNGSNSLILSNGSDFGDNRSPSQTEASHCEATTKNKNRTMKAEPAQGDEWVEQDETGVYITLVALPGGLKDLKRVRFSRKKFSEKQAEQWWAANRARVYQQYNVSMVDKSSVSIGREGLAH